MIKMIEFGNVGKKAFSAIAIPSKNVAATIRTKYTYR